MMSRNTKAKKTYNDADTREKWSMFLAEMANNVLGLLYPSMIPRLNVGHSTLLERAKACLQVIIDNQDDLVVGMVGDKLGLLLYQEVLCNTDPSKIYVLNDESMDFKPPQYGLTTGNGSMIWLSDSTCLLHMDDGKKRVPEEVVNIFESRELARVDEEGKQYIKFLQKFPRNRRIWRALGGACIEQLDADFKRLMAKGPVDVAVVVWNINDMFVKISKKKKGLKINPNLLNAEGDRADLHCEAFATLTAKAVSFATTVRNNSNSCIFIVGGASTIWEVNREFDRISNEISRSIIAVGVPVISGVPVYRRLSEDGGKFDEWHFQLNETNAFVLTEALVSASKLCCLLQGFRSSVCVQTLSAAELYELPDDRKVSSFREPLEYIEREGGIDDEEWANSMPKPGSKRTEDEDMHFVDYGFYDESGRVPTTAERQDLKRTWPNLDVDRPASSEKPRVFKAYEFVPANVRQRPFPEAFDRWCSYWLRHGCEGHHDEEGYVSVESLLKEAAKQQRFRGANAPNNWDIMNIIYSNEKQRFTGKGFICPLSPVITSIKAGHGHSIAVNQEAAYYRLTPDDLRNLGTLEHGTKWSFLAGIMENGLLPGGLGGTNMRKHVMMSPETFGSKWQTSGMRKDSAVILTLDREALAVAVERGLMDDFYQTEQYAVVQKDTIPPQYIIDARESKSGYVLYSRDAFAGGGLMRDKCEKCAYSNPLGATLCLRCWEIISEGQEGPSEAIRQENLVELGLTGWRLELYKETGLKSGQQSRRKGSSAYELAAREIKEADKRARKLGYANLLDRLSKDAAYAQQHMHLAEGVEATIEFNRANERANWIDSSKRVAPTSEKRKREVGKWVNTGWRKSTEFAYVTARAAAAAWTTGADAASVGGHGNQRNDEDDLINFGIFIALVVITLSLFGNVVYRIAKAVFKWWHEHTGEATGDDNIPEYHDTDYDSADNDDHHNNFRNCEKREVLDGIKSDSGNTGVIGLWEIDEFEVNFCFDSNGNRIYWAGEEGDDEIINQYGDLLVEHPTLQGAYFHRDPDGGNAVYKPQPYYSIRPNEPGNRPVSIGHSTMGRKDPIRESGGAASSSRMDDLPRNLQQRIGLNVEELEGLSAENKELYRCLAAYEDDSE